MVTATIAAALGGLAAVGGWRLWTLGRDVAILRRQVDIGMTARTDAHLDRFWDELCQLHQQHTAAVEARVHQTEAAAAQTAVAQSELARRVGVIEQWVRVWTTAARVQR